MSSFIEIHNGSLGDGICYSHFKDEEIKVPGHRI